MSTTKDEMLNNLLIVNTDNVMLMFIIFVYILYALNFVLCWIPVCLFNCWCCNSAAELVLY